MSENSLVNLPQHIIQLTYNDQGTVVVTPRDEDRFALTIDAAIQACAIHVQREQQLTRFRLLLNRLAEWLRCQEPKNKISRALLTERDGMLLFLVIMRGTRFDPELENDLTQLELDILDDPQLKDFPFTVMALPQLDEEQLKSFVNPQIVIRLPERFEK